MLMRQSHWLGDKALRHIPIAIMLEALLHTRLFLTLPLAIFEAAAPLALLPGFAMDIELH